MKPWPSDARKALKGLHIVLGGVWMGGATCLVLLQLPGPSVVGEGLSGVTYCMTLVDDWVIVPSCCAIVATAGLQGLFTSWGFVKFHWVFWKWVATLAFIAFGAFFLGPWIESMHALALAQGAAAFEVPAYGAARTKVLVWGGIQTVLLGGLVLLSVFKPWGRLDLRAVTRRLVSARTRTR